jgi:hypothetical protein
VLAIPPCRIIEVPFRRRTDPVLHADWRR